MPIATQCFNTSVADSATSAELLPANAGRIGASIYNDSTAILYLKAGVSIANEAASSISIQDDDAAASLGVRLYVMIDQYGTQFDYGHLAFVSPTVTDGAGTVKSGGTTFVVDYNPNAATLGYALTAIAAEGGLQADMPGTKQVLIPYGVANSGLYLRILNGAATAVAVYFDEDATNSYERWMAVMVDNADETVLGVTFSATASSTDHTVQLTPGAYWETPFGFQGAINGVWASDQSGSARISEWT